MPPVLRRTGCVHPLEHYAGVYQQSVRTLKGWLKDGRDSKDPCPLDDPAAVVEWWRRVKTWGVPDKLLALAAAHAPAKAVVTEVPAPVVMGQGEPPRKDGGVSDGAAAPAAGSDVQAAPAPVREAVDFSTMSGRGFESAVQELRIALEVNQRLYRRALESPTVSEHEVALRLKAVRETMDLLRKSENDLTELQKSRGDMILRADWEADVEQFLQTWRGMRERFVAGVLAKLPAEMQGEVGIALRAALADEDRYLSTFGERGGMEAAA